MFKPRLKLLTVKKACRKKKPNKSKCSMPKLVRIGNSVGMILSKPLRESIDWKEGDHIEYEYHDDEERLIVRNLSAEQRNYVVIHKKD